MEIESAGPAEFRRFRDVVFANPALQTELLVLTDPQQLLVAAVEAGGRLGFHFSMADAETIYRTNQREWTLRSIAP